MNCLIDIQGKIQSLKRSGHTSLGALPSNQLSYHSSVEAPFLTIFAEHDLNDGRMGVTPAQKKDLFYVVCEIKVLEKLYLSNLSG